MERTLLTAEEAAESLKVGRCKVYDLIRSGELESIKIGRLRRIPVTRCAASRSGCWRKAWSERQERERRGHRLPAQGRSLGGGDVRADTRRRCRKIVKYAKSRADANRKLREMVDRVDRNVPIPVSSMTCDESTSPTGCSTSSSTCGRALGAPTT